jgi:hypothetical protein
VLEACVKSIGGYIREVFEQGGCIKENLKQGCLNLAFKYLKETVLMNGKENNKTKKSKNELLAAKNLPSLDERVKMCLSVTEECIDEARLRVPVLIQLLLMDLNPLGERILPKVFYERLM